MELELFENKDQAPSGAVFSDCKNYRYCLWRIWDPTKPLVMFIGLNPSTANEVSDDPTIRRVKRFAQEWGYGGVYMMNLFAWVTPYPQDLQTGDPLGENDAWLTSIALKCEKIIFAWGNFKEALERSKKVTAMFPDGYALVINQNGTPKHPLYVKSDVVPVHYRNETVWIGYIREVYDQTIYCLLEKSGHLSKELILSKEKLNEEQIKTIQIGLCMRFDLVFYKIEFMAANGNAWY